MYGEPDSKIAPCTVPLYYSVAPATSRAVIWRLSCLVPPPAAPPRPMPSGFIADGFGYIAPLGAQKVAQAWRNAAVPRTVQLRWIAHIPDGDHTIGGTSHLAPGAELDSPRDGWPLVTRCPVWRPGACVREGSTRWSHSLRHTGTSATTRLLSDCTSTPSPGNRQPLAGRPRPLRQLQTNPPPRLQPPLLVTGALPSLEQRGAFLLHQYRCLRLNASELYARACSSTSALYLRSRLRRQRAGRGPPSHVIATAPAPGQTSCE